MINRRNYLWVKEHLNYLRDVHQLSAQSTARYWAYLKHLLLWADEILLSMSTSIRPTFPSYISTHLCKNSGKLLAPTSQKKTIGLSKRFFLWAKNYYPKEFRGLPITWINALRPPRIAQLDNSDHVYVSLEEVISLTSYPIDNADLALRRDQAAAAMLFLSGMRSSAFTTLPIKAVDLQTNSINQWPELGVHTKNSKRSTTFLLPIKELHKVVSEWDTIVRTSLPGTTPWYTPIEHKWGAQTLSRQKPGKNRHQALNKRLCVLYEVVGLPYKSAHKFRHGHAVYGLQHAKNMADYKAVSMNLMHEDIKTTDQIYAPILSDEVAQRIAGLTTGSISQDDEELVTFLNDLSDVQLSQAMLIAAKRLAYT